MPGSAKEIGAIFIAMGAGLVSGMGYLGYAVLYTVILSLVMALYVQIRACRAPAKRAKHPLRRKARLVTMQTYEEWRFVRPATPAQAPSGDTPESRSANRSRALEDDEVDRAEVEVQQCMELTATNRSRA